MSSINKYINTCKKEDCMHKFTNKCDTCIHTLTMKKDNYEKSNKIGIYQLKNR